MKGTIIQTTGGTEQEKKTVIEAAQGNPDALNWLLDQDSPMFIIQSGPSGKGITGSDATVEKVTINKPS